MSALVVLAAVLWLPACRSTAPRPRPSPGAPPGQAGIHDLVGEASWYGPGFEGRATASGEIFTGNDETAAHRTLPFGTRVRVTVTGGDAAGRWVDVRVNDRGPFVSGRVIDLSRTAAKRIGLDRAGVAPVELQVLDWGSELKPAEAEDPDRPWLLQIGAFASYENARLLRLRAIDLVDAPVEVKERAGIYRVFAGPFPGRSAAASASKRFRAEGIEAVLVPSLQPASDPDAPVTR